MPLLVIGLPRILFVHLLSILRQKDTGALFLPVPSFVLPSVSSSSSSFVLDL
jgi:hypothetical protein